MRDPRAEPAAILQNLRRDPSLRYNDVGRSLLMWLNRHTVGIQHWRRFLHRVPPHCVGVLAELARGCASTWASFADELEERAEFGVVANAGGNVRVQLGRRVNGSADVSLGRSAPAGSV
jgi:hypothetical protein